MIVAATGRESLQRAAAASRTTQLIQRNISRRQGFNDTTLTVVPPTSWLAQATMTSAAYTASSSFVDVLIVGGGVAGSTLARQLKKELPTISIGLVERGKSPLAGPAAAITADAPPNPRSYALSPKSLALVGDSTLARISDRVAYYDTMQVWEADSPAVLMFNKNDLREHYDKGINGDEQPNLGAVVEDGPLVQALWHELSTTASPCIKLWTETMVTDLQCPRDPSQDWLYATIQSSKGERTSSTSRVATRLLVAADGAQSGVRQMLGIPLIGFDYGRRAFITTVGLEETKVRGRAYQRFLKNGPLALLPSHLPHYATIVWSTVPEHAKELQREPDLSKVVDQLNAVLQEGPQRLPPIFDTTPNSSTGLGYGFEKILETLQFGLTLRHWQGDDSAFLVPPRIVGIEGPRFAFDLSCRQVRQYVGPRLALVGDAAHTMHPMAGQGLNLGLLDVDQLVQVITKAHRSGMDLATYLTEYQQHRLRHVSLALAGVHTLHQVFGTTTSAPFQHVKSLGMHVIQNLPPLKRQLVAVAAGLAV